MKISILIPHYKTGKMTAYTIAQLLKYKGGHEVEILVIDNNAGDGSIEYLKPFVKEIKYQGYPKDMLQSHGIAFDYVLPHVNTDYFITIESDSFPVHDNWLDYYEDLIAKGYDAGGSLLKLSGGEYMHPCGAFYSKKCWQEAKQYCNAVEYAYFPNMAYHHGFASHLMIHKSYVDRVLGSLYDYIEPTEAYKNANRWEVVKKMVEYSPVVAPFHNGMGNADESVKTYGQRTMESGAADVILQNKKKIIKRVGCEPGQWFSWFLAATGKKIAFIPTEVKWLPNRVNEQQEYTLMESGIKHLWGISAYHDFEAGAEDIKKVKQSIPDELYNSLPEHQKIKNVNKEL